MRNWTIPGQWTPTRDESVESIEPKDLTGIPFSPMRRQPLRKSGGFVHIENIFADLDEQLSASER